MRVRYLHLIVLLSTLASGCSGCGEEGLSTDMLEMVPADVQGVVLGDLTRVAENARAMSPFASFPGRWRDLGEALDETLRERLGVGLLAAERLVGWGAGEDAWALVLEGDFEGALPADGPEIAGLRAMALERDQYLVLREGLVLVGTEAGITQTVAVLNGQSPSLASAESERAEVLRDLLDDVGGGIFALAADAGDLAEQLGPLAPPARAFALSISQDALVARARLTDPAAASSTATQLRALLTMAIAGVGEELSQLQGDPDSDLGELLQATVVAHSVRLAADELVTIDSQGADLVVELDMREMGGGFMLVGVAASVAVPAFLKYLRRAKVAEAEVVLHRIYESAQSYYAEVGHFPSSAPRTPATVPCGDEAVVDSPEWNHPTWQALNFRIEDAQRFSYQFDVSGQGSYGSVTVSAFGDLDCDGQLSTFTLDGYVSGGGLDGGDYIMRDNELE